MSVVRLICICVSQMAEVQSSKTDLVDCIQTKMDVTESPKGVPIISFLAGDRACPVVRKIAQINKC